MAVGFSNKTWRLFRVNVLFKPDEFTYKSKSYCQQKVHFYGYFCLCLCCEKPVVEMKIVKEGPWHQWFQFLSEGISHICMNKLFMRIYILCQKLLDIIYRCSLKPNFSNKHLFNEPISNSLSSCWIASLSRYSLAPKTKKIFSNAMMHFWNNPIYPLLSAVLSTWMGPETCFG